MKELSEIKELIDTSNFKGQEVKIIGKENLNKEVVEYLLKANKKAFVDILDDKSAKKWALNTTKQK